MDSARRLIAAATRPLGDNHELRLHAEAELGQALALHGAEEAALAEMTARMETMPARLRWLAAACLILALLGSAWLVLRPVRDYFQMIESMSQNWFGFPDIRFKTPAHFTPHQQLLFGSYFDGEERSRALWQSAPDNPAYLAEHIASAKVITPELRDAAARIDPRNGYFDLMAAARGMDAAFEKKSAGKGKPRTIVVKDQAKLDECIAMVRSGLAKPEFRTYQKDLLAERMAAFPEADEDCMERFRRTFLMFGQVTSVLPLRKVCDILDAAASQCAARKDAAGFQEITRLWETLAERMIENGGTLVDMLVARVVMSGADFRYHAKELGLTDDADRFQKLYDKANAMKARIQPPWEEQVAFKSDGILGGTLPMLARQSSESRQPSETELKPMRLFVHSFLERIAMLPIWLLLLLLAGATTLAIRLRTRLARGLSTSMAKLLDGRDRALVFMIGVVVPLVWFAVWSRLTSLSAREFSPTYLTWIPTGGQFGSCLLTMLILPPVIASALLARRGKALGLRPRPTWPGWCAAAFALACVPAFGALVHFPENRIIYAVSSLAGFPLLWLIWEAFFFFFSGRLETLRRVTLARLTWPAWIFGALLVALLTLPLHQEEKMWVKHEQLFNIPPDSIGATSYENEITEQIRADLRKTLAAFRDRPTQSKQ